MSKNLKVLIFKFWGLSLLWLVIGMFSILAGFGLITIEKYEPNVWLGFIGIGITLYALYNIAHALYFNVAMRRNKRDD